MNPFGNLLSHVNELRRFQQSFQGQVKPLALHADGLICKCGHCKVLH